jgi:hypothetical protein
VGEKCVGRQAEMRGIYIIVEGPTEEEFVNEVLRPYFNDMGIYDVRAILIQTSPGYKGGDMKFERYKNNIENLLKAERDIAVTSLIDYFRLRTDFPKYAEAQNISDKYKRVAFLERSVKEVIPDNRFVPYIQLHEFEGLLFSSDTGFKYLGNIPEKSMVELQQAIAGAPELINDGATTAPSKRLERLIPGYKKRLHGPIIAAEIGIPIILARCDRFRYWLETITGILKAG